MQRRDAIATSPPLGDYHAQPYLPHQHPWCKNSPPPGEGDGGGGGGERRRGKESLVWPKCFSIASLRLCKRLDKPQHCVFSLVTLSDLVILLLSLETVNDVLLYMFATSLSLRTMWMSLEWTDRWSQFGSYRGITDRGYYVDSHWDSRFYALYKF